MRNRAVAHLLQGGSAWPHNFSDSAFPAVAPGLRQHGLDVLTAQEAGRCGGTDEELLAVATPGGRVVVTFDTDYLALDAASVQHAGIAGCPARKYSIGQLIQALLLVTAS